MNNNKYYSDFYELADKRSIESTASILGLTDPALRNHVISQFRDHQNGNAFLADPVFESTFPWEAGASTMQDLSGDLLLPSLVDSMDSGGFSKTLYPHKHQVEAWNTLLNDQKSIVVTSGTGSGKTECFMVPILNDLAHEYENNGLEQLVGIRALFLYPLNALINSQRERLRAWTEAYDDGVRFCLFNGNTEEFKHKDQGKFPNEVLTRKILRASPSPMLVTNATMLEYMLVRQVDAPIIEQSKGKLRWIVLDEAHTYLGSQAAELSLLLRRVMHTFDVNPEDVRFVATSATIGGDKAKANLRTYLANLAGISEESVVVIGGRRSVPILDSQITNQFSYEDIARMEPSTKFSLERYSALSTSAEAMRIRDRLAQNDIPTALSALSEHTYADTNKRKETLAWLDLCANTCRPGGKARKPEADSEPFLPLRGHFFHQVINGLWCCTNTHCSQKLGSELSENWPFGFVYTRRRTECDCGSPVFELVFCQDCNSPHLYCAEKNGRLVQYDRESIDEFSLDIESAEDDEENLDHPDFVSAAIIANKPNSDLTYGVSIDSQGNMVGPGMDTIEVELLNPESHVCVSCEYSSNRGFFFRRAMLGTPFYISNAMPTLLEFCQDGDSPLDQPSRGRRLITFTDSRQGTARISTKLQQDSERDTVRGLIYGYAAGNVRSIAPESLQELRTRREGYEQKIAAFEAVGEKDLAKTILDDLLEPIRRELESVGTVASIDWSKAVSSLQASSDISRWIFDYYKELNPGLFPESGGARVISEMLLLREFSRRPKRQNSPETLGLVSVQYPALHAIKDAPSEWKTLGLDLADWISYLKVFLDFYIRENTIIDIPADWIDWMGARIYPKTIVHPDSDEATSSRVFRWPKVHKGRNGRMVRLLAKAAKLDVDSPGDADTINSLMRSAWSALTKKYVLEGREAQILVNTDGTVRYALSREAISFQACAEAWVCPITHRLIDNTFKTISPYLPNKDQGSIIHCEKVTIPICSLDASTFTSDLDRKRAIRDWISTSEDIESLRSVNLWTDVSDRILEGGSFYRVAEHSAQQPASKLQRYEALFKKGKLNVLSCSTTMEMGVDIGGISIVAMNNVPPHPANYLQRAGRAGRRGETQAMAFSICKDNPHERAVFKNPVWPFITNIPAPYISLNSERIVQRHVHSLLLARFLNSELKVTETAVTSLTCEWFFTSDDQHNAPAEKMLRWLESLQTGGLSVELNKGLVSILKGSVLATVQLTEIIRRAGIALGSARKLWLPGYLKLKSQLEKIHGLSEKDPFRRKIEFDLRSMGKDYLLSELAAKAFLPGYGFPSGIVTFDHYSVGDFKRGKYVKESGRIDNNMRLRERPSRDLPTALREYAPGSQLVLDGLSYRSSGILLNKFSPNEEFNTPQRLLVEWRCHKCGAIGQESGSIFDNKCSDCDAILKDENVIEFIEPEGFAVDFYSSPTTDISSQSYIPIQDPWVSAGSDLHALFNPVLGTYRTSAEGHIFHRSSGEHGTGYAICLQCGRAESMTADGEFPRDLQPGKLHNRLQGKPGPESSAHCEGADQSYAIKESVHLGATNQTDVFELNLKHPGDGSYLKHDKADALSWTLAVVLRQALADIQGINVDEMGYMVKPSVLPGCDYPVASIVLYDKSSGGAGFSSSAVHFLPEMIERSRRYLECPDSCEAACQSCLLGFDTRFHTDVMDRHKAALFIDTINPFVSLPEEAQIFGPTTRACYEPIGAELVSASNRGGTTLKIFASGQFSDWNIDASQLKQSCLNARKLYDRVDLVLPRDEVGALSDIHKEDLLALYNFGVGLSQLNPLENGLINSGNVLAQVVSSEEVTTYGVQDAHCSMPADTWWDLENTILVSTIEVSLVRDDPLDITLMKPQTKTGDIEIDLSSECDGALDQFGKKIWTEIIKSSPELAQALRHEIPITRVSYSDCYVSSPLSLLLLGELIEALRQIADSQWSNTPFSLITGDKISPSHRRGFDVDWQDNQIKRDVCERYFTDMGIESRVHVNPIREMPHGRFLKISWEDNTAAVIRFDHGMGCWEIDGRPPGSLDHSAKASEQVQRMYDAVSSINVCFRKPHPTQIFVKIR